jgi:hypothetical protein
MAIAALVTSVDVISFRLLLARLRCTCFIVLQALRLAGAARAAGRTAAAAAGSQLFSLSDDGVMSLASLGPGDSLAVTAAEASQLQGMLLLLQSM